MKKHLPDLVLLTVGLPVMALLIYVIGQGRGWVPPLGILALAVVWITWYRHLVAMALRSLVNDPDDDDDLPTFPG